MSTPPPFPQFIHLPTTLSDFIRHTKHLHINPNSTSSTNTSSTTLHSPTTTAATSTTSCPSTNPEPPSTPNTNTNKNTNMAFGRRHAPRQTVTRETKPTLMTRLRGRNAKSRTVKTTTTVHPAPHHTTHTTAAHHTTARRSRWGGNTRSTHAHAHAQPVVHHKRHASLGDKISGAMMRLKGSLTHRPGVKAAGTRRMHGTDGRGSRRVY